MSVSKDQSIVMQVAAKIAADLTPKGADVNENVIAFAAAYDAVCDIILTSQGLVSQPMTNHNANEQFVQQVQEQQAMIQQAFPDAQPTATTGAFTVRIKGKQHGPIPQWLNDACAIKGVTEVWDNRDGLSANPKRPWFKSTTTNDAFWEPKKR